MDLARLETDPIFNLLQLHQAHANGVLTERHLGSPQRELDRIAWPGNLLGQIHANTGPGVEGCSFWTTSGSTAEEALRVRGVRATPKHSAIS